MSTEMVIASPTCTSRARLARSPAMSIVTPSCIRSTARCTASRLSHTLARAWAEARGGAPADVEGTGDGGGAGVLRIEFRDEGDRLEALALKTALETPGCPVSRVSINLSVTALCSTAVWDVLPEDLSHFAIESRCS